METQTSGPSNETSTGTTTGGTEFSTGDKIIYALHGKCVVTGVETRTLGADRIRFYKLEVQKSALSRSSRQEPAIWVPVATARDHGMRRPMTREDADGAFRLVASREYYFPLNESWTSLQPKLEAAVRVEGGVGLTKVYCFLHVLKRKQIVPSPEVARMLENVSKHFLRELSEILGEPIRAVEDRVQKSLRQKLLPDT
jgi:RNA polymerase-interacting CarD/CdnL/TRCF family regulator